MTLNKTSSKRFNTSQAKFQLSLIKIQTLSLSTELMIQINGRSIQTKNQRQ
jgi:hypothetical protein